MTADLRGVLDAMARIVTPMTPPGCSRAEYVVLYYSAEQQEFDIASWGDLATGTEEFRKLAATGADPKMFRLITTVTEWEEISPEAVAAPFEGCYVSADSEEKGDLT